MPAAAGEILSRRGQTAPRLKRLSSKSRRRRSRARAFTLIEILLTVALLGLLSTALVSGAAHLVGNRKQTPQEIFWDAVHIARKTALGSEHDVQLSFEAKEKSFVIDDRGTKQSLAVPDARDLTIELLQAQSSGGSILIGGQLLDTQTLSSVSFYADGTCSPFRVQFRTNGPARVLAIDPWTCASVLDAKNP